MTADFLAEAERLDLVAWRRDLHRHPELGFQEQRTAGIVARHLEQLGYEVTTGVAETGVVGVLRGDGDGPVAMVRADMDALPIGEESDHDYVSTNPGVMHACGHDGHVAIGMGVASLLARHRSDLRGAVKVVFQPAEEGLGGAERMIAAGVLDDPRPDLALGLHILSTEPSGLVMAGDGPVMAGADRFRVSVQGRGGHGAMPHQTVDAVVVAAHVVTALQTVVSRSVDPAEVAVVSVGTIRAGSGDNIIADAAEMSGTIRTFARSTRELVLLRVRDIVEGTARALGAQAKLSTEEIATPVINDPTVSARVREAAVRVVGADLVTSDQRLMASEDMASFLRRVPGCFFFMGGGRTSEERPHHHPCFDFDESVLPRGVAILCEAVADRLS
jgi:amidohydrolase